MNLIKITDFEAEELDIYARTTENQLLNRANPEEGIFIAESPKVVERALDSGCEPISVLIEERHIEGEGKEVLKKCGEIPIYYSEFDVLTQLTGFKLTRGMLCAMRRPKQKTLHEVCDGARRIAVLDSVVNPTNVGAIFRSAAALNIDAVLLTNDCSNPLYRRAIRVSMGNVFLIPWTFMENHSLDTKGIEVLHKLGYQTVAMALRDDSYSIDDERLKQEPKLAIVLGTEGDGLSQEAIDACDYTVKIPMTHGVDSLNVAAASAIAFWELGQTIRYKNRSEQL